MTFVLVTSLAVLALGFAAYALMHVELIVEWL